ncbi:hypothetical protein [Erythrobacter sp. A6_0]|uniref:hypothetical protein n=1 Tax=Erythrobacter sp. A6_0 TaxID=2821089 RepID=UPI001ADC5405|nr:hypothetical protein [Erythrobacter sp. A6_0]MBO9510884.1 hypothetical protein [Erythrobacter sp. A6_0]
MSHFVSARLVPLNALLLRQAELHGRRLDDVAKSRKVRDADSLTWVPDGVTGDPLALVDRLEEHVAGAFRPKGGTTIAQHMIVKMPDSIPTETEGDAYFAMRLAVYFAQETFGGQAVFAARIDRDEKSTNNVDLFLAPIYDKSDKKAPGGSKKAVSMTRHLKLLAENYGFDVKGARSAKESKQSQGKALQDAFADYLMHHGFQALRGKPKTAKGSDRVSPEIYGAKRDREAAGEGLELIQEQLKTHINRSQELDSRERGLDDRAASILSDENDIVERIAELQKRETHAREREIDLDNRDTRLRTEEDLVRERSADLDTRAEEIEADANAAVIDRMKAAEELKLAEEARRKADQERVLLRNKLKSAAKRENIASLEMARNEARDRELRDAEDQVLRTKKEANQALMEAESERKLAKQERTLVQNLLAELVNLTQPIQDMAARVRAAVGSVRKALMASGGAEAIEASNSPEMKRVVAIAKTSEEPRGLFDDANVNDKAQGWGD